MKTKKPKSNTFSRKISIAVTGLIVCIILAAGWEFKGKLSSYITNNLQQLSHKKASQPKQQEEWINIFVHGTFSCYLGLFSLPAVIQDAVEKTFYKKLVESKRKKTEYFVDQAVLQRGLIKIQPSYDLHVTNGQHFSAYPLAQVFQDFSFHIASQFKVINNFYTFGWSGLLSQKQRRIEAVRFYNALTNELKHYQHIGKQPKIRLVAHSHGGNLCLNLAAINDLLSLPSYDNVSTTTSDTATNESLVTMFNYIKTLPNEEGASDKKKFKRFDYVPSTPLVIDELVLFGTPVQVETEPLFFSPTFKKIYHFYSESDSVQKLDLISTKKKSERRITHSTKNLPKIRAFPHLIQGKIVVNRHRKKANNDSYKKYSLSHKDMWAISWHPGSNPLAPLPVFVLTPLLLTALEAQTIPCNDVDINIRITRKYLKIQVAPSERQELNTLVAIPRNTFEEIKNNLKRWDPYHTIKS